MKAEDLEHYLFPEPSLLDISSDDLRVFIVSKLRDAVDMTDGSDPNSDVRIDYAQDTIHQARDILISRGETFPLAEQKTLWFLDWSMHGQWPARS